MSQDTTITDELAAVEQCDRDAAADYWKGLVNEPELQAMRDGKRDDHWKIQQLAHERLSTRPKETPTEQVASDWWKPEPGDPFWMLEAEDGEWLKNEHSMLGTRDASKAIRFPTEAAANNHRARMNPSYKWWSAKATEHLWIKPTEQGEVAGSIVHRLMACFDFSDVLSIDEIRDMVADEAQAIEGEILASLSHPVSTNMQVAKAVREAIALLDEINERATSRQFYGIDHVLHGKLATIRAILALSTITASSTTEGGGE